MILITILGDITGGGAVTLQGLAIYARPAAVTLVALCDFCRISVSPLLPFSSFSESIHIFYITSFLMDFKTKFL